MWFPILIHRLGLYKPLFAVHILLMRISHTVFDHIDPYSSLTPPNLLSPPSPETFLFFLVTHELPSVSLIYLWAQGHPRGCG